MIPQQLVLDPLGLMTEPNKLGHIPAGAFSSALNCVMRSPGIVENIKSWQTICTLPDTTVNTTVAFVITPPGPVMLVIYNGGNLGNGWQYCWFNQTTGATLFGGPERLRFLLDGDPYEQSIPITSQPGFSYAVVGEQLFVNAFSTVLCWDTYRPTTTAQSEPRPAGVPAPVISDVSEIAADGIALAALQYANYTAIIRRTTGDKVTVSPLAPAIYGVNTFPSAAVNMTVRVGLNSQMKPGDRIEIYRTKSKPTNDTNAAYPYQRAEEAGAEYLRLTSYELTSADILATFVDIVDAVQDGALGEPLYTNQAVNGLGANAFAPPAVKLMAAYKGHLFGLGTTRPPSITLRPKGPWLPVYNEGQNPNQWISGTGSFNLLNASWSASSNTVNIAAGQAKYVRVGTRVLGTAGLDGTVTAVGATSFTVSPNTTGVGSAATITFFDQITVDVSGAFLQSWSLVVGGFANDSYLQITAPALKLPAVTSSGSVVLQPTDGFTVMHRYLQDSRVTFGVSVSNPTAWDPVLARNYPGGPGTLATIETKPNAIAWSEKNDPEAWPYVNVDHFSVGVPCALVSTRDAIYAAYTDAIWQISGTGGTAKNGYDWRFDPIKSGLTVSGSQDMTVLLDTVYARTSDGFLAFSDTAIKHITKGRVHDVLSTPPWTDGPYNLNTASFLIADEENSEILMREPSAASGRIWIYNTNTDTLSQTITHSNPTHGDYSRTLRAPVVVGRDGASTWAVKAQTGAYGSFSFAYQPVYADNAFAQRTWHTLDLSVETSGGSGATIQPTFNATPGNARGASVGSARLGYDVPCDSPATGNTIAVSLDVTTDSRCKLQGFALTYTDETELRRNR